MNKLTGKKLKTRRVLVEKEKLCELCRGDQFLIRKGRTTKCSFCNGKGYVIVKVYKTVVTEMEEG